MMTYMWHIGGQSGHICAYMNLAVSYMWSIYAIYGTYMPYICTYMNLDMAYMQHIFYIYLPYIGIYVHIFPFRVGTQPTVAHGFKTHTIACVFHDFEGFQEMT